MPTLANVTGALVLLAAAPGCTSGSVARLPVAGQDVRVEVADDVAADKTIVFPDPAPEPDPVATDGVGDPGGDPAMDLPGEVIPGATPCKSNSDCPGGYCVHGWDGDVCTTPCLESCPPGWACKQIPLPGQDPQFACVPVFVTLCNPCRTDQDCIAQGYQSAAFCLDRGLDGSFCTEPCTEATPCPPGYSCVFVEDSPDRAARWCVYQGVGCECHGTAAAHGFETGCAVSNDKGVCRGSRHCTKDGMSPCDAPQAMDESCNGADDDCDDRTDEGFTDCDADGLADCVDPDLDGDGIPEDGDGSGTAGDAPCTSGKADHCDDNCPKCGYKNPGQEDDNGDGVGDVCDACQVDKDQDGHLACSDCDDLDASIHPGADEKCNGRDDDCDGKVDPVDSEGCKAFFRDDDGDGWGLDTSIACLCKADAPLTAQVGGDCDDLRDTVHPGGTEVCNGLDDDCDGEVDPPGVAGCKPHYMDADRDTFGDPKQWKCYCAPNGPYSATEKGDCDDDNPATYPDAPELCDEEDNDCDGITDDGADRACATDCGAGIEVCVAGQLLPCTAPPEVECIDYGASCAPYVTCGECMPRPSDLCDGTDEDCDGVTDPGFTFIDWDGTVRGLRETCGTGRCAGGEVICHPDGASARCSTALLATGEVCNGEDDDCDGVADDGVTLVFLRDADQDGFGLDADGVTACAPPEGFVAEGGDCDDGDDSIHPGAAETCDHVDQDCDGKVDEGLRAPYWLDWDKDGYGNPSVRVEECSPPEGYIGNDLDCDDSDGAIHPGTPEECDKKDNDCDGVVDRFGRPCNLGCADGQEVCEAGGWLPCDAPRPLSCTDFATCQVRPMCVDACPAVPPEACNGVDDDCDGLTPPAERDVDGDGYRGCEGDCDDGDPQVFPGAAELCDGKDNDCGGVVDNFSEPCSTMCGNGTRTCLGGQWGTCSAMAPKTCTDFATCGTQQLCVESCPLAPPEDCDGKDDNCNGVADETFQCVLGRQETTTCGPCGYQTRTCLPGCVWSGYGECIGVGVCTPGSSETQSCGGCGSRTRYCDATCNWGPFGECSGGICTPFATQYEGCGDCGQRSRTCTSDCYWGSWSSCYGEGVCSPGEMQTEACGLCGTRSRTCTSSCQWGSWSSCTGQGVCSPGASQTQGCGLCGTQSRTCNSSCQWGSWGSCTGQGVCSPGSTIQGTAAGCDVCQEKHCGSNCQWGSCHLLDGKTCTWENGNNWECCAYHKWHFCLPPSYGSAGCKWSPDCVYVSNACY